MTSLSIIIPVYNGSGFLESLIQTISKFTISHFECVFIDNNSTDGSMEILQELLKSVSFPYVLLHEKKQGAGHARNTGIAHAKGKYLAFFDCDDVILPQKFARDLRIFESNPEVDFVFCRAKRFYQDGRELVHPITGIKPGINHPPSLGMIWLRNFFCLQGTGSVVAKKSIIQELGCFHPSVTGEDAFLFIRMGLKYTGYFYNETYFHYYRHPDSTVSKANKKDGNADYRYFELRKNLFADPLIKLHPQARSLLTYQMNVDGLKLHQSGGNPKILFYDSRLKGFEPSKWLYNPVSLFINKQVKELRYNPFFQVFKRLR